MKPDELVKALRWLSKVRTYCDAHMVNCRECEFHGFCTDPDSEESIGQQAEWTGKAADLIEQFQAELSQKTQQLEAYKRTGLTPDEFKQSVDYVLELNKKCKESTGCTAEEIANIKDQLSTYKAAMQNWHEEDI